MKKLITILFLLPTMMFAQDTYFSGRYAVRSYINPTLMSHFKGTEQGRITYRRHWSSLGSDFPFETYSASLSKKWEWLEVDEMTLDLRLMKESAPGGSFSQNQVVLGGNYKKIIQDRSRSAQFISLGFSGGFNQNRANWDGLWFGNQFDFGLGGPNSSISSGENIDQILNQKSFSDLNLGLAYELFLPAFSMNANLSISHLTRPDISFLPGVEIRTDRRITANISLNIDAGEDLYFIFSPMYTNQGVFHTAGTKLGLAFAGDQEWDINFGVAATPILVQNFEGLGFESLGLQIYLEKSQFRFDFSYDATISKLSQFNGGRGGFEFSFIYTRKGEAYDRRSSFARHFHLL